MNDTLLTPRCAEVSLPLRTRDGQQWATLVLRTVVGTRAAPLVDASNDPAAEPSVEPIRVIEGGEYRYEIFPSVEGAFVVDCDLFSPNDDRHLDGRMKPRLRTGRLMISVTCDDEPLYARPIEVVSQKLDYLTHYRWMMAAVAKLGTSLVLERFAASETSIRADPTTDAATLYQRFCFLKGLLLDGGVLDALRMILARPSIRFQDEEEPRSVTRGARASSSSLSPNVVRPGPRVAYAHPVLSSLPRTLPYRRPEPSTDTAANRFVRFALENWIDLLVEIETQLESEKATSPIRRGKLEVAALRSDLEEVLRHAVVQDAGRMHSFPVGDQVLLKQAGYREVFQGWLLTEVGAALDWRGGEDVFGAGQKNVAALYEYWVFIELCRIVGAACGSPSSFFLDPLVRRASNGWTLDLDRNSPTTCATTVTRYGRELIVRLAFNRTFKHDAAEGSWTRRMRPDCTLEIEVVDPSPWTPLIRVHFDAKYRLDRVEELHAADDEDDLDELLSRSGAKPADLLKMHAYRDAVVHAAGAYVIFPGDPKAPEYRYSRWGEILPGLGALPLRPSDAGAEGAERVREFVTALLDHASIQGSRHERARFWEARSTTNTDAVPLCEATPNLITPPADARALFGFVRTREQLEWVRRHDRYNLRADDDRNGSVVGLDAQLRVDFVVLFGEGLDPDVEIREVCGAPELMRVEHLYSTARGQLYLVLPLKPPRARPKWLTRDLVNRLSVLANQNVIGAPFTLDWLTVMYFASS